MIEKETITSIGINKPIGPSLINTIVSGEKTQQAINTAAQTGQVLLNVLTTIQSNCKLYRLLRIFQNMLQSD
jgi:hypothetical protein